MKKRVIVYIFYQVNAKKRKNLFYSVIFVHIFAKRLKKR